MGASGTLRGPVSGAARPVAGQSQAGPKAASALLAQACPLEAGQGPDHSPHLRRRHQVVARSVLASPLLCSARDLDVPTPSASGDQGHIQLGWHRTVLSVCTTTSRWWALEKGEVRSVAFEWHVAALLPSAARPRVCWEDCGETGQGEGETSQGAGLAGQLWDGGRLTVSSWGTWLGPREAEGLQES